MKQLVKVNLGETEVWVEASGADTLEPSGPVPTGGTALTDALLAPAIDAAHSLSDAVRGYCTALVEAFVGLPPTIRPKEVSTEFGLKLDASAKLWVINSGGEVNVKITAKWQLP